MGSTGAREEILGDVGRALKREGKTPFLDGRPLMSKPRDTVAEITSRSRQRRDELINQFASELTTVGGCFHRATTSESAFQYINQIVSDRRARIVVGYDAVAIEDIDLVNKLGEIGVRFVTENQDDFIRTAAVADIGLSGVDYALADTGTLVLLARKGHARSVSLLPPVHIAVLKPEQILSDLSELFPLLRSRADTEDRGLSSAITLITGPSRTADIELTLVVGVHGPQHLHIVLVED